MKTLLVRSVFLLALGAVAGLLLNGLRPDGGGLEGQATAAAGLVAPTLREAGPDLVNPDEASSLCADPTVLIADARDALHFAQGHVAGAVHLPCAASGHLAGTVPDLLRGRSSVIVYGESTDDAVEVADGLRRRSRDPGLRVMVLEGGFAAWDHAGFACTSGACPDCAEGLHEHEQESHP